jgi:hypothetical protein
VVFSHGRGGGNTIDIATWGLLLLPVSASSGNAADDSEGDALIEGVADAVALSVEVCEGVCVFVTVTEIDGLSEGVEEDVGMLDMVIVSLVVCVLLLVSDMEAEGEGVSELLGVALPEPVLETVADTELKYVGLNVLVPEIVTVLVEENVNPLEGEVLADLEWLGVVQAVGVKDGVLLADGVHEGVAVEVTVTLAVIDGLGVCDAVIDAEAVIDEVSVTVRDGLLDQLDVGDGVAVLGAVLLAVSVTDGDWVANGEHCCPGCDPIFAGQAAHTVSTVDVQAADISVPAGQIEQALHTADATTSA